MFCDAYACAACAEEYGALVAGGYFGAFDCVDEAGEDDGAGALDIVVEAGIGFGVSGEGGEGVFEVFELDDDASGEIEWLV